MSYSFRMKSVVECNRRLSMVTDCLGKLFQGQSDVTDSINLEDLERSLVQ